MWVREKKSDFSLTCPVQKWVMLRSVFCFSNLLERCFSCVGPPVNLQVILALEGFPARLTDEISDTCKKILLHLAVDGDEIQTWRVSLRGPTWMDNHMAMQVVWQVELFPTAWMGANFGPPFPVNEVDMILQREGGEPGRRLVSSWGKTNKAEMRSVNAVLPESC